MTQNETQEQGLIPVSPANGADETQKDYMEDIKGQAQEYQQKLQDAAVKAKDYANEKLGMASEKFKELQQKDPKELVEEAKDYARKKPGQTILISAAVGLVLGLIFRGGRR